MATTTKNTLPNATTSSFNTDLQAFLRAEGPDRFAELHGSGIVISGGLHSTAAGLTGSPGATVAYPGGYYVAESGSITYPDDKSTIWVVISKDQSTSLGGNWVRVSGTNYAYDATSVSRPTLPAACLWLMEVTTSSGAITAVTDIRRLARIATVLHSQDGAPGVNDDDVHGFLVGDRWVDVTNAASYECHDSSTGAAVWGSTTAIQNVVEDTTPQLGGDLDVNSNSIVSASDGNIPITPNGTGVIQLDGIDWPDSPTPTAAQIVEASSSSAVAFANLFRYEAVTSDPTVVAADQRKIYKCSGASFAPTLDAGANLGVGFTVGFVHNGTTSSQVYTITANGSEAFELTGQTTFKLQSNGDSVLFMWDGASWTVLSHNISPRIVTISRDISTATGTQAVTGVGFKPSYALVLARDSGGTANIVSWGMAQKDLSGQNTTSFEGATAGRFGANNKFIQVNPSSGNQYSGDIQSWDADGLTISWTKTGSPTGTISVSILCFP